MKVLHLVLYLSFQKTNAEAELEAELEALDTEIKNIKVLVVEDIPLNQLLMKTLLDDFGFESRYCCKRKNSHRKTTNQYIRYHFDGFADAGNEWI